MSLQDIYIRARELTQAYYQALGLPKEGYLENLRSTVRAFDLDRWPVVIRREHEGAPWVVYLEHKPDIGDEWMLFEAHVKARTTAALQAHKNLRQLSRDTGIQYATLWRAKDGRAITKRIYALMGMVPHVTFMGPNGPIPDGEPIPKLTLEQAHAIPVRQVESEG